MIKINVITGFLGAGKTTLINKLLDELLEKEKVAIVENDYGDVAIDTEKLSKKGLTVKGLNYGCICCSNKMDFIETLNQLSKASYDRILVEPSGIFTMSEIKSVFNELKSTYVLESVITLVNVGMYFKFIDKFKLFVENQIAYADTIVLNRIDESVEEVSKHIGLLNPDAVFVQDELSYDLLTASRRKPFFEMNHHVHPDASTKTYELNGDYTLEDIKERLLSIRLNDQVIRIKGYLSGYEIQYVSGEFDIYESDVKDNKLSVIGWDLDDDLFNG
ncbi:hypothetical protein EZV73_07985 [Acidaminobacter sp. JC074]|uniref:CobW family GTP-binding protein n=1 Tax=Acidaminobacter sp. JC074 TaxID=2530199 RepID=UPI001F106EB7|nr:GTP-binding protein [Acidaminobacter sp. JC074]MCH4887507.1 hypothetical protein [Acidaminobacter sp. JC074]